MGLAASALQSALPSQQIAVNGGPTAAYQLSLGDGTSGWAATVPSNALAPWDYAVSHTIPPYPFPAIAQSQSVLFPSQQGLLAGVGFGDKLDLIPPVSGRVERHEKLVILSGPPGQTTEFLVRLEAVWLTGGQGVLGTGTIRIEVEGFGLSPDIELAFAGHLAAVSRTVAVRLGPLPGEEIRVRITTELSLAAGQWVEVVAGASVLAEPIGASYVFEGGYGCGQPIPDLIPIGVPSLGRTFSVDVTNLVAGTIAPVMLTGFSNTRWGGVDLPWDASPIGMSGCLLRTDITFFDAMAVNGDRARWSFTFPTSTALGGLAFFQQAVVVQPGANAAGLVFSNAYRGVIGT